MKTYLINYTNIKDVDLNKLKKHGSVWKSKILNLVTLTTNENESEWIDCITNCIIDVEGE